MWLCYFCAGVHIDALGYWISPFFLLSWGCFYLVWVGSCHSLSSFSQRDVSLELTLKLSRLARGTITGIKTLVLCEETLQSTFALLVLLVCLHKSHWQLMHKYEGSILNIPSDSVVFVKKFKHFFLACLKCCAKNVHTWYHMTLACWGNTCLIWNSDIYSDSNLFSASFFFYCF